MPEDASWRLEEEEQRLLLCLCRRILEIEHIGFEVEDLDYAMHLAGCYSSARTLSCNVLVLILSSSRAIQGLFQTGRFNSR